MNTSSTWPSRTSTTAEPRQEARKPTASASASTKPSCRSSIRWRSANASTPASSSCRLTSIPGSPGTTNSDHIRGAGATAKRQCKPSLTLSHSPGRNHWPHDVGQTQPFRHQTGQLSDQVSASTHYVLDLWFERVVKPRLRGEAHMIRYIDDFVMCFQYREDALRVQDALCKRLGKFGLTLEPTKTKLVEFGRFAQRHAAKH